MHYSYSVWQFDKVQSKYPAASILRDWNESTTLTTKETGKMVDKAAGLTPSMVMTASAGESGAQPRRRQQVPSAGKLYNSPAVEES